jgi:hypothetical protein
VAGGDQAIKAIPLPPPPKVSAASEADTVVPSPPPIEEQASRHRPRRRLLSTLAAAVTALTLVAALFLGFFWKGIESRGSEPSSAATKEPPPSVEPQPSPEGRDSDSFRVRGTLFIPSPTGRIKDIKDLVGTSVCRNADGDEQERLDAQSARLSFTSDKDGQIAIGASGTTVIGDLDYSRVDGEPMCGWRVSFSAELPADTTAFYIHYGYTDYYWGPFSRAEGEHGIGIAFTH